MSLWCAKIRLQPFPDFDFAPLQRTLARSLENHLMRYSRRALYLFILTALLIQSSTVVALVKFDFEGPYFMDPGQPVLDHSVVELDGVFHLFYLRGNPALSIGHATTTDWVNWTIEPTILEPGTWDTKLWAPHIFPLQSGYFIYYTGVNAVGSQQTGIALSYDLDTWFKWLYNPVYHPSPSWAEWSETYFTHGRDPHVIAHDGKFYMFVTGKTFTNEGAVACAESNDLVTWTDIGPIYVHNSWHVFESVFMERHNDKWHMFFTEEAVFGSASMTSDSLLSGWSYSTRRLIDPGHAPQITKTSGGAEIFSRHSVHNDLHGNFSYTLRFDTLTWVGDQSFVTRPWALARDWTLVTGDAFALQPCWGNNPFVRGEDVDPTFEGVCWIGSKEKYTGPMAFGVPGQTQGDGATGIIRSRTFSITGNSMSLLVGGGNFPDECYARLVDEGSGAVLFGETGDNDEEMTRRYWDLRPHKGKSVYVEIADLSVAAFGHINVDDIIESNTVIANGGTSASGGWKHRPLAESRQATTTTQRFTTQLRQNHPNPFNPTTSISFEVAIRGHVRLDVFDASGAHVRTVTDANYAAGLHQMIWAGEDDEGRTGPSGVYFYRMTLDGRVIDTRKMVLLK